LASDKLSLSQDFISSQSRRTKIQGWDLENSKVNLMGFIPYLPRGATFDEV